MRLVLERTVSTKPSLAPLTVFSTSGGAGERLSEVLASKAMAPTSGNSTTQKPLTSFFAAVSGSGQGSATLL